MFVKICGLSTGDDVAAAVAAGADALGFVFAVSPRQVTPERAHALCGSLGSRVIRVAVMRHPTAADWAQVRDVFEPDWLQTDAEDFATLGRLGCKTLPVYRNAGPSNVGPPNAKLSDRRLPGRILFEGARSGHGERADWPGAARVAARTRLILAGGLDCDNVVEAIETVQPWGVDVSSGVERTRGVKDPRKIREFIARVRAAEREQAHVH